MNKNIPKYLTWWVYGEDMKSIYTRKEFSEHTNKKAWELEIIRLKKSKFVTRLKYIEL